MNNLKKLVSEKYPHLEEHIHKAFGYKKSKDLDPGKMSLNPNASVDDNLKNLTDVLNHPATPPEHKMKALSSLHMIMKKLK